MSRKQTLATLQKLLREGRYEIDFEALAERLLAAGVLGKTRSRRARRRRPR